MMKRLKRGKAETRVVQEIEYLPIEERRSPGVSALH